MTQTRSFPLPDEAHLAVRVCVCVRACEGHKEGHVSAEPTDKAGAVAGAPGGAAVHLTCCTGTLTLRHIWQLDQGLSE